MWLLASGAGRDVWVVVVMVMVLAPALALALLVVLVLVLVVQSMGRSRKRKRTRRIRLKAQGTWVLPQQGVVGGWPAGQRSLSRRAWKHGNMEGHGPYPGVI